MRGARTTARRWITSGIASRKEFRCGFPRLPPGNSLCAELPLQNFRVQPYNLLHAIRAAALFQALREDTASPIEDRRPIISNDLKILPQPEKDGISIILTEDRNTLSRLADRLRERDKDNVRTLLLADGFTPGRIANPAQDELNLSPPPS